VDCRRKRIAQTSSSAPALVLIRFDGALNRPLALPQGLVSSALFAISILRAEQD
jgi:hypothetical protein